MRLARLDVEVEARVSALVPAGLLGPQKSNFYATDEQSSAPLSSDYAQVSIEWAEHMPDTIPPNVLAINAITGDHWSSRWWANRSANAFGMLAWWYQGAWPQPGPPSTPNTPTGQPLPPGSIYFDTTLGVMMVWNGSTWVNASAPGKATTSSLYYLATAGQTVFPLGTVDRNGKTFAFNQSAPEGLQAYVNGVRLEPTFDFTVDTVASSVTFLARPDGELDGRFDLLTPVAQLTASGTVNTVLLNPITPDGTTTHFTGLTVAMNGHLANVAKNEELAGVCRWGSTEPRRGLQRQRSRRSPSRSAAKPTPMSSSSGSGPPTHERVARLRSRAQFVGTPVERQRRRRGVCARTAFRDQFKPSSPAQCQASSWVRRCLRPMRRARACFRGRARATPGASLTTQPRRRACRRRRRRTKLIVSDATPSWQVSSISQRVMPISGACMLATGGHFLRRRQADIRDYGEHQRLHRRRRPDQCRRSIISTSTPGHSDDEREGAAPCSIAGRSSPAQMRQ